MTRKSYLEGPDGQLSVVIPAFNAEALVAQAIQSALGQILPVHEVIVVDDGSTDQTFAVASAVSDKRVTVLTGPNLGVSSARNKGLALCSGDLVAFLDSDDYWLSHKLSVQLGTLASDEVVAVGSFMRHESVAGRVVGVAGQAVGLPEQLRMQRARLMPCPLSSFVFRRAVVADVGGFDESLDALRGQVEDLELLGRVARAGLIEVVPEVLGAYRVHRASASARAFAAQQEGIRFIQARVEARDQGGDLDFDVFRRRFPTTRRERFAVRARGWYRLAGLAAAEGRWLRALGLGLLSLASTPRYTLRRLVLQQGSRFRRGPRSD